MAHNGFAWLLGVALLLGGTGPSLAQQNESEKKVYNGPTKVSFGRLDLVLAPGASSEVQYQPDASRLVVKTLAKDARVVTSARYLILLENVEGTMEARLATGRTIRIEPGKSDIVGRALVDDPGQIVVRLASTGVVTVLDDVPAAAISGVVTVPSIAPRPSNPRPESSFVSPSGLQGFGTQ